MNNDLPAGRLTATTAPRRWPWAAAAILYAAFLLWHEPWFSASLSSAEVAGAMTVLETAQGLSAEEKATLRAFLSSDDGQPFYNVNLMLYKDRAQYLDGSARPGIVSGEDAANAYARLVVPMLLKRGSYPVFSVTKIAPLLVEGAPGADFFQDVSIVRYRSRRDMLDMIVAPEYKLAAPHKFASLAKNVAVPTRAVLVVHLGLLVPAVLLLAAALLSRSSRRTSIASR